MEDCTLETERMSLGTHVVAEFSLCRRIDLLDNLTALREAMIRAATACGATVLETCYHKFSPQGVSGVLVLAESHMSIHTWPERGCAAIDMYTCGEAIPQKAIDMMAETLEAKHVTTTHRDRVAIVNRVLAPT